MVENVSKKNVNPMVNIDSSSLSHDSDLFKWIEKKKKNIKTDDIILSASLLTPVTLERLLNVSVPGGGLQQTAKQSASFSCAQSIDTSQSEKGDSLRRRVVLVAAELSASTKPAENSMGEIKASALKTGTQMEKGDNLHRRVVSVAAELSASAKPSANSVGEIKPSALKIGTQMEKGDSLPRHVRSANAQLAAIAKPSETLAKPSENSTGEIKASASNRYLTSGTQQSAAPQHILADPTVNVASVNMPAFPLSGAESGRQLPKQHKKEEGIEVRATFQGLKQPEILVSQLSDTTSQNKNTPALQPSLAAHPEATAVKSGSESPLLEVNYPFQRWSGDHSVKVLVPTDARRESAITLLPSDNRAADVLARSIGQLTSLTPELLKPPREHDDQQQRRQQQQQQQDEEQE